MEVFPNDQNVFNEVKFVKSGYKKAIIHAICVAPIHYSLIMSHKVSGSLNILINHTPINDQQLAIVTTTPLSLSAVQTILTLGSIILRRIGWFQGRGFIFLNLGSRSVVIL